ncbi:unnamed protein product [Rotaria sordida]|uniref:HAT C-terminal dimerisation domain-containing protein n=1 Tax=Rotaria sordida TaxID=392033 RepID=A0A819JGK8_9BILA|nr:unnamed protein product [Rotaria sordida]CAF1185045.1 unnamed protein product [Rotaria sordida]CAF3928856.1 unnamed protein product [Rotaria sordida]CAF4046215.1 unnamed protein product [Rotaria sordida]
MATSEDEITINDSSYECSYKYTKSSLSKLSKEKPNEFRIMKKEKTMSNCWSIFGQPARKNEQGTYVIIEGFVSCSKCLKTYAYNSNTGTKTLNAHSCVKQFISNLNSQEENENILSLNNTNNSTISTPSSTSTMAIYSPLNRMGLISRKNLSDKEITKIKDLSAFWLCEALRPFSIMDDIGLRRLVQECINIGAKYGCIDVDMVLRHRSVISNHIKQLATTSRQMLTSDFIEPLSVQALTIIPDLWSDKYNHISFLGATTTYVDATFNFRCFDLFCREYQELNKQSENILTALKKNLMDFNIHNLSSVNLCSDRGSNFVKCFKQFRPIHCYAHRINNILARTFFKSDQSKKSKQFSSSLLALKDESSESSASEGELECHESDDESIPSMKIKKTKKVNTSFTTNNTNYRKINHMQLKLVDIPIEAQALIEQISKAKKLVKYIKKANLNQESRDSAGSTLKQCTQVRWLSLFNTLISIVNSYSQIKTVLTRKGQAVRMTGINKADLMEIVRLLIPFKTILTAVQYGTGPSLHMALLSTLQLRQVLSSADNLYDFYKTYYNQHDQSNEVDGGLSTTKALDTDDDDDNYFEGAGIKFFRLRLLSLLNSMFDIDIRHYASVFLHPKYHTLKYCTKEEIRLTHKFVRDEIKAMNHLSLPALPEAVVQPPKKTQRQLFEQFTYDNTFDFPEQHDDDDGEPSANYFNNRTADEVTQYMCLVGKVNKNKDNENPLPWWFEHKSKLPKLSLLARRLFSIPATSASVERQFSSAGLVYTERRNRLNTGQLDNVLLVRAMQHAKINEVK